MTEPRRAPPTGAPSPEGSSASGSPAQAAPAMSALLRYRLRALSRRAAWVGRGPSAAVALLVVLGAAALAAGIDRGVAGDLTLTDPLARAAAVRDRSFWYLVLATLIFSYTTFETFFRAPDTRFVARLPIRGRTRWLDLALRTVALHLPLLLPGIALAASLVLRGAPILAVHTAMTHGLVFTVGLATCARLHLLAGRSLLGEATPFRHALAGGLVADDAAFLLYSPAAGLTATLLATVLLDVLVARALGLESQPPSPALAAGLTFGVLAATAALIRASARDADRVLPFVIPRFAELDVPPPYREDGLPAGTPGEGLARWLPGSARPYFLRDLRQLRRRHRLDRVLLWLFGAWLARAVAADAGASSGAGVTVSLSGLAILTGVFLVSSFRLRGAELAAPALDATLPHDRRGALIGELTACLVHPAWGVLLAAAAVAWAHGLTAALITLGLGALVALGLTGLARLAATLTSGRVDAMAIAWRAAVVFGTALVTWSSR
ncbi:MAG: hypothetical protein H6744_03925 [Deltaproteobacteria bacterium]|nr:hypothetical protein [Deltaproteobacteria bacterium]MCB9785825.1 hypothetical protein [Deltaproteobacteria bacterium]